MCISSSNNNSVAPSMLLLGDLCRRMLCSAASAASSTFALAVHSAISARWMGSRRILPSRTKTARLKSFLKAKRRRIRRNKPN